MQYKAGAIGRVLMARFDHGEPIMPSLLDLLRRENVAAGWLFLFGAVTEGTLVAGPKESSLPPEPMWREFPRPFEIVGAGSVAMQDGAPSVHLHASLGRGDDVLTGCIRREGKVFIVLEALILEILGIAASRRPDERTGMELLTVE